MFPFQTSQGEEQMRLWIFLWACGFAAAAAAADSVQKRTQRSVLAHAVCKRGEHGPSAARKYARREHVPARSENEQDNENPKTAIAL